MDEAKLREKLTRIEALFAGATTDGERVAAAEARRRIQLRLQAVEQNDPPIEHRLAPADVWSAKILITLLRRYDLKPYRYKNQRRTTIMVKAPASFIDQTLWPEFEQITGALRAHLDQVTERILAEVFDGDGSDVAELNGPPQLSAGTPPGK